MLPSGESHGSIFDRSKTSFKMILAFIHEIALEIEV